MVAQQSPLYTWYSVWPKSLVPELKLKYRFSLCCRYSMLQEAAAQDKDFCLDHTLNLKHTHVHCSQFKLPCTVLDANGMIVLYVPLLTSMCKESTEPCDHTHCLCVLRQYVLEHVLKWCTSILKTAVPVATTRQYTQNTDPSGSLY